MNEKLSYFRLTKELENNIQKLVFQSMLNSTLVWEMAKISIVLSIKQAACDNFNINKYFIAPMDLADHQN